MNIVKTCLLLMLAALLNGCGRSKPPQLYVLNPIPCHNHQKGAPFSYLKIGLNPVQIPEYIQKPEITLHCSNHQVTLAENHHWAESLKSNITRVLQTNLSTLLPASVIEKSPRYSQFSPNYILQVTISEFKTDFFCNSIFRADYLIYHDNQVIKKGQICTKKKLPAATPLTVVSAMNDNITSLTQEIATSFKQKNIR